MAIEYTDFSSGELSIYAQVFVYGGNRSGKTWFASTFPNPLFIVTENGVNGLILRKTPGKFVKIEKFEDIFSVFADLKNKKIECESIVIDTLSQITSLVMDAVSKETGKPLAKFSQYEWSICKDKLRMVFSNLLELNKNHHICVTAQEIVKDKEGESGTDYYGPDTLGTFREQGPGYFDWFLYAESMTVAQKTEYALYTSKRRNWPAGDRLNILSPKEPNDFNVLLAKLRAAVSSRQGA